MNNKELIAEVRRQYVIGTPEAFTWLYGHAPDLADALEAAQARIAELEAVVTDLSACACGCPISEHESYGEGGESCENETHICNRVFPAVAATLRELEGIIAIAHAESAVIEEALLALETTAERYGFGSVTAQAVLNDPDLVASKHLKRDKEAAKFFDDLEHHFQIYGYEKVHYIEQMLAAYRAAGGEGV